VTVEGAIRGDEAHLVVRDDGRGFDAAGLRRAADAARVAGATPEASAIELAFLPGVTTRAEATGLSGRGVGLDAVRARIAQLHGRVQVQSEDGLGAAFHVVVPTDLSVLRALLVGAAGVRLAVASASVVRLGRASWGEVTTREGRTFARVDGVAVPLFDLADALGLPPAPHARDPGARWPFVVIAAGDRTAAIRVDELLDEREVVVRPLGARVRRAAFVAGGIPGDRGDLVLLLDAADLVTVRPGRPPGDEAPRRKRRVLVVDDSLTTRQLERAMLEAAGYDVRVAEDGARGWELLETEPFDLVVSDIEMPGLDGFQLLRQIRSSPRHDALPVVLVTALADEGDRRRALDLGASGYLLKSRFDQEELLDLLARLA
jgi:two-component system chemotaxis sensor kinase CheA